MQAISKAFHSGSEMIPNALSLALSWVGDESSIIILVY